MLLNGGPNPQTRSAPGLEIEPVTLQYTGQNSTNWAILAMLYQFFLNEMQLWHIHVCYNLLPWNFTIFSNIHKVFQVWIIWKSNIYLLAAFYIVNTVKEMLWYKVVLQEEKLI